MRSTYAVHTVGDRTKLPLPSRMWRVYRPRRYTILFYSLLAMLIALPATETLGFPQVVARLLFALCLIAAVMPSASRGQATIFLGAVLILIVLRFVSESDEVPINFGPVLALYGLTGLLAAASTLRYAVQSTEVDSETVYAVLSTYLLAGLFFGVIYSAIEFMQPGSFSGPDPFTETSAIYYSFVTLATLGYGDFLPRTDLARGIATFEVISGQLFLAVLVARLIGAFGFKK